MPLTAEEYASMTTAAAYDAKNEARSALQLIQQLERRVANLELEFATLKADMSNAP